MICECGHHMGAHRPFCRDCEFNTAGCRTFTFSIEKTLERLSSHPVTPEEQARRRRDLFNREREWQRLLSPARRLDQSLLGTLDYVSAGEPVLLSNPSGNYTFLIDTSNWVRKIFVDPEMPRDEIRFEYPGQCGVITNIGEDEK